MEFEVLESKRIVLRKAREKDFLPMLENVWSDEAVYQQMLFQPTLTVEEAICRCSRSIRFQSDHLAWFVALKATDEAIGFCGINEAQPGHFEECGICVGRRHQGIGLGTELLTLLLDLSFTKLGAEDFRYGYFAGNDKSKNLADRFGFRHDRTELIIRPWDQMRKTVCSCILTKEEYLARRTPGM